MEKNKPILYVMKIQRGTKKHVELLTYNLKPLLNTQEASK